MSSDRRSHPTVRPHALALGVIARPGAESRLAFLGAPLAAEVGAAMQQDALGALSTFPVRHRVVLVDDGDESLTKVPATWKRHALAQGPGSLARRALSHLFALGGEASLLVVVDGPVMPLGELFDGLLGLAVPPSTGSPAGAAPPAVLVGPVDAGGIFALGLTRDDPELVDLLGLEGVSAADVDRVAATRRIDLRRTPPSYVVDGPEGLRRLKRDVMGGAFAPLCRKLLDRPDVERALVAAGA